MFNLSDVNYCATVVQLHEFIPLDNCANIKHAVILNSKVIVSVDAQPGDLGLYFPIESELDSKFLANNNLYSSSEKNVDKKKKGFFGNAGRVRAVKLRGHISDGFFIPLSSLCYHFPTVYSVDFPVGTQFNSIGDLEICKKYVRNINVGACGSNPTKSGRTKDIISGQFFLHEDKTKNLRHNIQHIMPGDFISITEKFHGCNASIGNVLCQKKLSWWQRALVSLGVPLQNTEYRPVWASRRVIKGIGSLIVDKHFYGSDVWGAVTIDLIDKIPEGWTLYGEIVGYAGEKQIQKGYHYGEKVGDSRFYCFGIKIIDQNGREINLNSQQVYEWCEFSNIATFKPKFCGRADELVSYWDIFDNISDWQKEFLNYLEAEYCKDEMCKHNNLEVPAEGIVLRRESMFGPQWYKLKNWKFLEWETKQLDTDEVSIEEEN